MGRAMHGTARLVWGSLDAAACARFWSKVDTTARPSGCWVWTTAVDRGGYGRFAVRRISLPANRVSLTIKLGRDLLPGMQALHTCDNPPCVNPEHLWEGTGRDNMADMVSKGRQGAASAHARGERNGLSVLTASDVLTIRALLNGGDTKKGIARSYGVSPSTIRNIAKGETWSHLKEGL